MKKIIYIIIPLLIFITLVVLFLSFKNNTQVKSESNKSFLAKIAEDKKINENTKKYQPKETKKTVEEGIDVSAVSAILVDENTNEIIYQKNPKEKKPPASIIKMLTFSLALEFFKEDEYIKITQYASEQISNKINMKPGEELKVSDILYGMMMISANDAAYAIADAVPGKFNAFIKKANEKVRLLGLTDTVMKNPAGLDEEGQISTAFDMATITRYTLLEHPKVIDYAGETKEHSVYATEKNEPHWWFGHLSAMLKRYPGMIAAKTGYTDEARSTFIGIAERDGRRLVIVILGSSDANNDVTRILDYGFSH